MVHYGFSCIKCATFNSQDEVSATWQVALRNASNDDTICSGTAISDQWVLTSARCVCNNDNGIEDLSIRYGKKRTCYYRDRSEKRRSVSEIYCYPNFDPNKVTVDLAIINLKTPLPIRTLENYAIYALTAGGKIESVKKLQQSEYDSPSRSLSTMRLLLSTYYHVHTAVHWKCHS